MPDIQAYTPMHRRSQYFPKYTQAQSHRKSRRTHPAWPGTLLLNRWRVLGLFRRASQDSAPHPTFCLCTPPCVPQKEAAIIQKGQEWCFQGCPAAEKGQERSSPGPSTKTTTLGVLYLPSPASRTMPWVGVPMPWVRNLIAPSSPLLPLFTLPLPLPSHHLLPGSPDPGVLTNPSPSWCHHNPRASS